MKWISVQDRLPFDIENISVGERDAGKNELILLVKINHVRKDHVRKEIGIYANKKFWIKTNHIFAAVTSYTDFMTAYHDDKNEGVTHWMLPAPPKS